MRRISAAMTAAALAAPRVPVMRPSSESSLSAPSSRRTSLSVMLRPAVEAPFAPPALTCAEQATGPRSEASANEASSRRLTAGMIMTGSGVSDVWGSATKYRSVQVERYLAAERDREADAARAARDVSGKGNRLRCLPMTKSCGLTTTSLVLGT